MPATPTQTRAIPSPRTQAGERTQRPTDQTRPKRAPEAELSSGEHPPVPAHLSVRNRVGVLLVHIPRLSIRGQARLAAEVGVSRSTICRLVGGRISPSYRLARGVTDVLERLLGYPLDMRDVFTTDGTYPTPSGCELCRCRGCLPEEAYRSDGRLRPEWRDARSGEWSVAGRVD